MSIEELRNFLMSTYINQEQSTITALITKELQKIQTKLVINDELNTIATEIYSYITSQIQASLSLETLLCNNIYYQDFATAVANKMLVNRYLAGNKTINITKINIYETKIKIYTNRIISKLEKSGIVDASIYSSFFKLI